MHDGTLTINDNIIAATACDKAWSDIRHGCDALCVNFPEMISLIPVSTNNKPQISTIFASNCDAIQGCAKGRSSRRLGCGKVSTKS